MLAIEKPAEHARLTAGSQLVGRPMSRGIEARRAVGQPSTQLIERRNVRSFYRLHRRRNESGWVRRKAFEQVVALRLPARLQCRKSPLSGGTRRAEDAKLA